MVKNSRQKTPNKIFHIERIRKEKEEKGSLIALLKDTHKAVRAIRDKTCLICKTKKLCVTTTGLCSACYDNLTFKEKAVADREAQHKIIEIKVTDNRWQDTKDT